MNCEEEIAYREQLLSRVRGGGKINPDERLWVLTHRSFNRILGYPYLNTDIIELIPDTNYTIKIKVESRRYDLPIIPTVTVPGGEGRILTNAVYNPRKNIVERHKAVKMLGVVSDETELSYRSKLGLIGVSYECDYVDEKLNLKIQASSDSGVTNLAMISEDISKNKKLYRCKNPKNNSFDSMVFSIEWNTESR